MIRRVYRSSGSSHHLVAFAPPLLEKEGRIKTPLLPEEGWREATGWL